MEKKKITPEMIKLCRKDFPQEAYSKHPTKTFLTTLKAMYVTERLNEVFGIGRWRINNEVAERTADYVVMRCEFESLDYDVEVTPQYGGHKTEGKNTEIADGYKSAITDGMSKIASYFEIGINMFKGKISPQGESAAPSNEPELPWLNKWTSKAKTEVLADYTKIIMSASEKGLSAKDLKKYYKISKEILTEVEKDLL